MFPVFFAEFHTASEEALASIGVACRFGYHLLASPGNPAIGVALLVNQHITQDPPNLITHLRARVFSVSLPLQSDQKKTPTTIVAVY